MKNYTVNVDGEKHTVMADSAESAIEMFEKDMLAGKKVEVVDEDTGESKTAGYEQGSLW